MHECFDFHGLIEQWRKSNSGFIKFEIPFSRVHVKTLFSVTLNLQFSMELYGEIPKSMTEPNRLLHSFPGTGCPKMVFLQIFLLPALDIWVSTGLTVPHLDDFDHHNLWKTPILILQTPLKGVWKPLWQVCVLLRFYSNCFMRDQESPNYILSACILNI